MPFDIFFSDNLKVGQNGDDDDDDDDDENNDVDDDDNDDDDDATCFNNWQVESL